MSKHFHFLYWPSKCQCVHLGACRHSLCNNSSTYWAMLLYCSHVSTVVKGSLSRWCCNKSASSCRWHLDGSEGRESQEWASWAMTHTWSQLTLSYIPPPIVCRGEPHLMRKDCVWFPPGDHTDIPGLNKLLFNRLCDFTLQRKQECVEKYSTFSTNYREEPEEWFSVSFRLRMFMWRKYCNLATGICFHSAMKASVRLSTDVGWKVMFQLTPKVLYGVWWNHFFMDLDLSMGNCHDETGKIVPQTVVTMLKHTVVWILTVCISQNWNPTAPDQTSMWTWLLKTLCI